ncbi:MAG: Unknown protein [uncultured Sulfurovum sp.]|uniref:Uncharacterized protein n=1 Tax=uncultured Sulfurovum sp. TaxID=269237 RepID=A0A6S6SJF3_9BACT|nr:MAG: Unknown protein [uncultured Sulfurovum sp.]
MLNYTLTNLEYIQKYSFGAYDDRTIKRETTTTCKSVE